MEKFNVQLRSNMMREAGTPEQKRAEAAAQGVTLDGLHDSLKVPHEGPTAGGRGQTRTTSVASGGKGPDAAELTRPQAASRRWEPPAPSPAQQKVRQEFTDLYRGAGGLSNGQLDEARARLAGMSEDDVRHAAHAVGLAFGEATPAKKLADDLIARVRKRRDVMIRTQLGGDRLG
jgi:hypothetical protein